MTRIGLFVLLLSISSCAAQEQSDNCAIAFYNVENLFDTEDDPATADNAFTPTGAYRYTDKIYTRKLHNIATVIDKLEAAIVGLAEIENNTVLKDLIAQPELAGDRYKYIWYNSPDPRGIDVALLYNPKLFKVINSKPLAVKRKGMATRDVLYVCGVLLGDTMHILVNHWPSRNEGVRVSEPKRMAAAMVNKQMTDSLLHKNTNSKIIIMGDMNDNPDDASITDVLHAGSDKNNMLYNPWIANYNRGKGTSVYHQKWDHFDQVIISSALTKKQGWYFNSAEVFDEDFIRNKNFKDAYPFRSFKGKNWNNGYSDHLPVILHLRK